MTHLNLKSALLKTKKNVPEKVGTLIVGAGMSGLYNAWRLREECNEDVVIFEQSWRTGGRLDSDVIDFGTEKVKEEEGGMRFTFDSMDNLMALFMLLDLDKDIVPFPMKGSGSNRLCFRGRSFNQAISATDNYAIWKELYNLSPSEQNINPSSIINTVFNRILAANPQFKERPEIRTPEFWQKFRLECQWNGIPLNKWTLWNLYTDMGYSKECINLLYGLAGFNGTFLSTMNAGEAYQLLEDFPSDPDFKTLKNGFSTLPNALAEKIGGERIFLNTVVNSIEELGKDGCLVCYTHKDEKGKITTGKIKAAKVILCIPRLPLEKLFNKSNALNKLEPSKAEKLWDTLQTTTNQPLLKINLYFDKAWWGTNLTGQEAVGYGPNFSDLPTGSVYPFYAIDEPLIAGLEYERLMQTEGKPIPPALKPKLQAISDSKYNKPAALTIYCDFMNINFWKALQGNGPMFTSKMQEKYNKQEPQVIFPASQAVVDAAIGFFKQIFSTNYIPDPVLTSARIWQGSSLFNVEPSEQFDYGVHQWGLNADDKEVMKYMTQPFDQIPLYTCGESYSDYQGWVEGALRSANLVHDRAYGLKSIADKYKKDHGTTAPEAVSKSYAAYSSKLINKYILNEKELMKSVASGTEENHFHPEKQYGIDLSYFDVPEKN